MFEKTEATFRKLALIGFTKKRKKKKEKQQKENRNKLIFCLLYAVGELKKTQ